MKGEKSFKKMRRKKRTTEKKNLEERGKTRGSAPSPTPTLPLFITRLSGIYSFLSEFIR